MTKKLLIALLGICLFTSNNLQAQCSSCTITISGTEILPQIVPAGVKLCITATGDLQGALLISGGEVCNEGAINSNGITLLSGTLTSTGTINSTNFAITKGTIDHQGISTIDSVALLGDDIIFNNSGNITNNALGITKSGVGANPTMNNSGSWSTNDLGVYANSNLNNTGDLIITNNFANFTTATTVNQGFMSVANDFANNGDFSTNCMISVGNDFANSGVMTGPATGGCGGFSVVNATANSGDFAVDDSFLDMCDASSPGFDGNIGTIGSNVTYCTCTNSCQSPLALTSLEFDTGFVLYPNPFSDFSTLKIDNFEHKNYTLSIYNMQGQLVRESNGIYEGAIIIEQENLTHGAFYYTVKTDTEIRVTGKLLLD